MAGEGDGREQNPGWTRLLGWPLIIAVLLALLLAPFVVKLVVSSRSAPVADGGRP